MSSTTVMAVVVVAAWGQWQQQRWWQWMTIGGKKWPATRASMVACRCAMTNADGRKQRNNQPTTGAVNAGVGGGGDGNSDGSGGGGGGR